MHKALLCSLVLLAVVLWLVAYVSNVPTAVPCGLMTRQLRDNLSDKEGVIVCLTSIPPRINNPWVTTNLQRLSNMPGVTQVRMYVPWRRVSGAGPFIEVPRDFENLHKVTVVRCEDEGPHTKLAGPLRDLDVNDDALFCVVDDDVVYLPCAFLHFTETVRIEEATRMMHSDTLYTFCGQEASGFQGYGGRKRDLLDIIDFPLPSNCFDIDDTYVNEVTRLLGVRRVAVTLHVPAFWCSLQLMPTILGPQFQDGLMFKSYPPGIVDPDRECQQDLRDLYDGERADSYANNPNRKSSAGKRSKPVRGRKDGEEWVEYESAMHAARELGLELPTLRSPACRSSRILHDI